MRWVPEAAQVNGAAIDDVIVLRMTRQRAFASLSVAVLACRYSERAPEPAPPPVTPPSPLVSLPTADAVSEASEKPQIETFDRDPAGAAPSRLMFGRVGGRGAEGTWRVRAEADAPSAGHVLAQLDADATADRFPVALMYSVMPADARFSVRCKPVSGQLDQSCALAFRAKDVEFHYVARASAVENNVRLEHVARGRRTEIATWSGKVERGVWHQLRADVKGEHFEIYFDGQKVIDAHDARDPYAGRVGVGTRADSITYFDDLTVESWCCGPIPHRPVRP